MSADDSNEFFTVDDAGDKQDADLHATILDNEEAEEAEALEAVLTAIDEDGMDEDEALELYGTPNTPERLKAHRAASA